MNEKRLFYFIVYGFIVFGCVCTGFNSCKSGPVVVATDESVVSSQISARQIGAINERIRGILSGYDEFIAAANQRAIQGNLDARTALDEYDEFVQGLIAELRELERRIGEMENRVPDTIPNSNGGSNPFLD
jgi:hypothetical protein